MRRETILTWGSVFLGIAVAYTVITAGYAMRTSPLFFIVWFAVGLGIFIWLPKRIWKERVLHKYIYAAVLCIWGSQIVALFLVSLGLNLF